MLRRLAEFPLYPLLLALSFPTGVVAETAYMFDLASAARAFAIVGLVFLASYPPLYFLCRRRAALAGLLSAMLLTALLFPNYWMVSALDPFGWGSHVPGAVALALLLTLLLYLRERIGDNLTVMLNAAAVAACAVPLVSTLSTAGAAPPRAHLFTADGRSELVVGPGAVSRPPPNIHHIVLDAYASQEIMRELFGHDTGPFVAALRALGFVVAERAWAPYNQTYFSMAATFQGGYLDARALAGRSAPEARADFGRIVVDGPVQAALAPLGYRFLAVEPGMDKFFVFPDSTRLLAPESGASSWLFEHYYFRATRLYMLPPFRRWVEHANRRAMNAAVRGAFAAEVPPAGAPYHVYQHVLAPHPPFSMNERGEDDFTAFPHFPFMDNALMEAHPERRPEYRAGYVAKTRYVERALLAQLEKLVESAPEPTLILVQSDHGSSLLYAHNAWRNSCLKERFGAFFAVYASDPEIRRAFARRLAGDYNTVNIYRDVFRLYFGAAAEPLANRSHFVKWVAPAPELLPPALLRRDCAVAPPPSQPARSYQ